MLSLRPSRAEFIDAVLTSSFAGQVAKRFTFDNGEVGAVYTLSRQAATSPAQPVLLLIATFPPRLTQTGVHDFGIDYYEHPVTSAQEAAELLAQFDRQQATLFRANCRVA